MTPAALEATVDGAGLVWVESPTNPMLDVVDLAAVIAVARAAGALVVVDNTFATPFGQTPLALGADVVLHSATKLIGGHSDLLLGAVVIARRVSRSATPRPARLDRRHARHARGVPRAPRAPNAARAPGARAGHRPGRSSGASRRIPASRASAIPAPAR